MFGIGAFLILYFCSGLCVYFVFALVSFLTGNGLFFTWKHQTGGKFSFCSAGLGGKLNWYRGTSALARGRCICHGGPGKKYSTPFKVTVENVPKAYGLP